MKRILSITIALSLLMTILTGCPYESKVAIDETPTIKIDTRLLGAWVSVSENSWGGEGEEPTFERDETTQYKIEKKDEFRYKITEIIKYEGEKPTVETYEAFLSKAGDKSYLNVRRFQTAEIEEEEEWYDETWRLNRVDFVGDRAKLTGITENITEQFETSAELKAFITKHQSLSFFFEKQPKWYEKK